MLGRPLAGKYFIIDRLGCGGFASIYRAVQLPLKREVAIKVIHGREADEGLRARFFREAHAIAQLNHDATVSLYDYGEEENTLFMVLELIRGVSLKEMLRDQGGRVEPRRAIQLLVQVLEALAEAHQIGLIHRDLKPANLMLLEAPFGGERVKVLDFGIAKVLDDHAEANTENKTREGMVVGTPRYMAPEQARGCPEPRSDLYSVGIILFQMLMGFRPFDGNSTYEILRAHNEAILPELPDNLPKSLKDVIYRSLAKEPELRYASAAEMAQALTSAQSSEDLELFTPSLPSINHMTTDSTSKEMQGSMELPFVRTQKNINFLLLLLIPIIGFFIIFVWKKQDENHREQQRAVLKSEFEIFPERDAELLIPEPFSFDPYTAAVRAAQKEQLDDLSLFLREALSTAKNVESLRERILLEPAFQPYLKDPRIYELLHGGLKAESQHHSEKKGRKKLRDYRKSQAPQIPTKAPKKRRRVPKIELKKEEETPNFEVKRL